MGAPLLGCLWRDPEQNDEYAKVTLPCLPFPSDSDAARGQYLRDNIVSSYHYFGSAAAGSVVDVTDDFKVFGTEGLHVVDASVLPVPTTINPQGTIMALGHYVGLGLAAKHIRNQVSASRVT